MKRLLFAVCATWWCACSPAVSMEDAGSSVPTDAGATLDAGHQHDAGTSDAGVTDAGHMHEVDAGDDAGLTDAGEEDAGHMHPLDAGDDAGLADAGELDAGHMHPLDAGEDAGTNDAGEVDAGHMHPTDAGVDAGVSDAGSAVDAGHMHDAGFIDAGPPIPQVPFETMPASVNQMTQHVATLPRPARVTVPPRTNCPHLRSGLTAWNPLWSVTGADVTIPVGASVILRGNSELPTATRLRSLTIPVGSELIIDDVAATYTVTDVRVLGALRLGSPTCRLDAAISFVFDTNELVADAGVRSAIAAREGLGLVVDGQLEAFGKLYQPTWTRLAQTANASTSSVTLSEAVDWQPGQQIVITTTSRRDYPFEDQNEVRTISSITGMGTVINFTPALLFQHYGGGEYQAEVALLSRSIEMHTAPSVLAAAPNFGGHVLIHGQARVSGLELRGLGQQNFVGRYPFHLHHADGANSFITDSSVWQSNWRSVVVHRTNDTLVSRNVAFDVFGHSYYLEDGVEVRNELSFNLAARTKIMGPTDSMSLAALNPPDQFGPSYLDSPTMVQPADRAAAGFYISNGNNRIVGNAASGGFAGFTFPSVPVPTGGPSNVRPLNYAVSYFDGNSAHTAGYFWWSGACIYIGGVLDTVDVGGVTRLRYLPGRTTDWNLLRHGGDVFNNTRTFQCTLGINHWGSLVRVVNFESYDNELLGALFGSASIQSGVVVASTANTQHFGSLRTGYYRGFQFYDTGTQTVLSDVVFRNFQPVTPGTCNNCNNCALLTMVHSDEFTPQNMNATQRLYFDAVHESVRFCSSNSGTLASRNFNLYDSDGSATRLPGDGLPMGARLVGSGYSDSWRINASCVRNPSMNMWLCPMTGTYEVASIGVTPNMGVRARVYSLANASPLGDNWYSTTTSFDYAQLTGPARFGWHHSFPNGVPSSFAVQVKQVPLNSFVVLSFSLPPTVSCSVAGWTNALTVGGLLASSGAAYATDRGTCFLRIPPTPVGDFQASMLRVQNQTWSGNPTPTTYFTVQTGCSSTIPACQSLMSTLPTLP